MFFGGRRSPLIGLGVWQHVATDPHEVADAGQLDAQVTRDGDSSRPLAVVIEGINEFLGTPADAPLASLIKRLAGNGHLVIAEGEVSALGGSWPLFSAVKSCADRAGPAAGLPGRFVGLQDRLPPDPAQRVPARPRAAGRRRENPPHADRDTRMTRNRPGATSPR